MAVRLLCVAPGCRKPGSHTTDCKSEPDKPCLGCLPAPAADGLRLCLHCTNRLGPNAIEAAVLWHELGLCLIGVGDGGEIRTKNPGAGISLREPVLEHRALIRHTLVSWTLLITEERGIGLPWRWKVVPMPEGVHGPAQRVRNVDQSTAALGRLIATHTQWLAAHGAAADAAGELHDLVATGRALRQPSGTQIVRIGPCPAGVERACTGILRALLRHQASLLPSAVTCDTDETHTWDSTQWTKLGRTMKARAA